MAEQVLDETPSRPPEEQDIDTGDFAGDYLLGRQVANEYHNETTQLALEGVFSKGMDAMSDYSKISPASYTAREKPEHFIDVNKVSMTPGNPISTKPTPGTFTHDELGGMGQAQVAGATAADPNPYVDPAFVGSVSFGAPFYSNLAVKGGEKLLKTMLPSLPKAFTKGVISSAVSIPSEYAIGAATEGIERDSGFPPWLFNVSLGLASGITIERFAEDMIFKHGLHGFKSAGELVKDLRTGNFENPFVRTVAEAWQNQVVSERGIFLGEGADTINLLKFRVAKDLDAQGKDANKIRIATGFFKGADGRWRWEASDKGYSVDFEKWRVKGTEDQYGYKKLGDIVTDEKLFSSYPELKNWIVNPKVMDDPQTLGATIPSEKQIDINVDYLRAGKFDEIKSALRHEIQHTIEEKEGWASGASWRDVPRYASAEFEAESYRLIKEFEDRGEKLDTETIQMKAAYNVYRKFAGEVEARDAVERWMKGDAERLENFPEAMRVWREYERGMIEGLNSGKPFSIEPIEARMRELGYDFTDPEVVDAFANRNYEAILPRPAVMEQAKDLIWRVKGEYIDPETGKVYEQAMENSRKIFREEGEAISDSEPQVQAAVKKIKDRFGVDRSASAPIVRSILKSKRSKILKAAGGVENVAKYLREQGYPRNIAGNIQTYLKSERDLPMPTTVKEDALAALKYKGLSAGTEWYRETHLEPLVNGLSEIDTLRLFALIAHTSRQTDPAGNLTKTLKVWKKYLEGASPEEAAKGSGLGEARVADLLRSDDDVFRVIKDEIGQEFGEVKVRDFATTISLAMRDPEALRDYAETVVDFRMAQLYYPTRTAPKWEKASERSGARVAGAKDEQTPLTPILKERIKERVLEVRDYLRKHDDADFWTIDRVQAALWTHVKDSRVAEGLDRGSSTTTFEVGFRKKAAKLFNVKPEDVTDEMLEGYAKATGVAPLKKYKISISPITKQENIDQAIADGDIESANAMRRALALEKAGDYDSLKEIIVDDAERIFDHPTITVVGLGGAQGRFVGGREFSLDFTLEASDYDILRGKVAQFLKRYRQTEGYISELQGFMPDLPKVIAKGEQGPSIHLKFDRELTDEELSRLSEDLDKHGIGGSTYREEKNELVLDHILKYIDDFNDFRSKAENALTDWLAREGMPVPKWTAGYSKHDILEGGENYARAIERATKREETLGLGRASHESRRGQRARETVQARFVPGEYSSLAKIPGQPTQRGFLQRLREQRGTVWGASLTPPPNYRFEPRDLNLPFEDKSVLDKIANINLNHISDVQGIHDAMAQIGKVIEDSGMGLEARRGVRSNRTTKLRAVAPETLELEALLGRKPGGTFNAEQAVRARYFLTASAQNLVGLAQKAAGVTASDLDKAAFVKALNLHGAIQAQVSGMTAEAGRLLQSFKINATGTQMMTRQLQETLQNLPGGLSAQEMAAAVATFKSPEQVGKFVNKIQHAKTSDMVIEAWINSLLSGPTTHAVNIGSTALTMLLQIPERWLAGQFARALKHSDSIATGEAGKLAYGMIEGFRDGLRAASQVMKTGEASDIVSKVEKPFQKAITAENIQNLFPIKKFAPNLLEEGGMLARAVDLMGEGIRIPTTMLQAEDSFFKSIAYRMELRARAYRDAAQKFPDDPAKVEEEIQKILADPEKYAPDVALGAQDFARYATFTKGLGRYGSAVQALSSHPVMKFVIPFVRTPTNLLKFGMERSPFGIINVIKAGTNAERDLALARMSLGSAVMMSTVAFAAGGMITGGGPSDPQLQAALRRTGWQPYSIKIGDKYYSYNRIEPLGMVLGLASDFAEMTALAAEDYEAMFDDFGDLATAIVASISKNVTSKTWLKGISDVTSILTNPEYYGKKWIEGLVGTAIPTLSANIERAIDPEQSAVWGMTDALKARIPGYSKTLPPKRDYWGEPVGKAITDNNWLQGFYSMASPVYISEKKNSPIDKELVRLKIGLPNPKKTQNIHGIEVPLDAQEYDDLIVKRNQVPVMGGKNLKDSLNDLIQTEQYKGKRAEVKEDMIKDLVQTATDMAREMLYKENAGVRLYVDQQTIGRQRQTR